MKEQLIMFSIVVSIPWLQGLVREFLAFLREKYPDGVRMPAEIIWGDDDGDKDS
jgi:hypothetical protein